MSAYLSDMARYLVLFSLIALCLAGCKKYSEGPFFSFRSKEARLVNHWQFKEAFFNGGQVNNPGPAGQTYEYQEEGVFILHDDPSQSGNPIQYEGVWEFDKKKELISTTITSFYPYDIMTILKLRENKLWTILETDSGNVELHFEPVR